MRDQTRLMLLLACVAIGLAGCAAGAPATGAGEVRPISDILVAEVEFTRITASTATLAAETTIPVVCAVVYGPTSEYGLIATDQDMAGGGHQDHSPLLTGLEPETAYVARLQGVGPDGTLYRSQEYTFRTPAADPGAQQGPNLALPQNGGAIAAVSSNFGGGTNESNFGALNAIDGDAGTQWSSDGDGNEAWIEIELAAPTRVSQIGLWTRTMGSSAQIESFQVLTDQGETYGPFKLADAAQTHYFETDFQASRLRFEVLESSGGNTGAVEIEIYGSAG